MKTFIWGTYQPNGYDTLSAYSQDMFLVIVANDEDEAREMIKNKISGTFRAGVENLLKTDPTVLDHGEYVLLEPADY